MIQERLEKLKQFVAEKHINQVRKYTNEPYYNHVESVANILVHHNFKPITVAAAYCHDLFEDTDCNYPELLSALQNFGYSETEANEICLIVNELTDQYTKEAYPDLNRQARKKMEAERLRKISDDAQSIKYADLIDNTSSIVCYDRNFAKVYLQEKKAILFGMKQGNSKLYELALELTNQFV